MSDLYLVAHKCRGAPTFSVAVRLDIGTPSDPSPWWIDTVGGWRIYPFWTVILEPRFIDPHIPKMSPEARDCFGTQFDRTPESVKRQPKQTSTHDLAGFLS